MKEWRCEQARKRGVTETAIAMALRRGHFSGLVIRRVNQRVVFVSHSLQLELDLR